MLEKRQLGKRGDKGKNYFTNIQMVIRTHRQPGLAKDLDLSLLNFAPWRSFAV